MDSIIYTDVKDTECLRYLLWLLKLFVIDCSSRHWEKQEPLLKTKGPAGEALLVLVRKYLTPPATSTAVERLFSCAGLIMEEKRNRLSPDTLDMLLFVRESFLLGVCKLEW